MNVYEDPWLIEQNRRILEARGRRPASPGGDPAPEHAHLSHGTMTAYREGCRCGKCRRRNLERCQRQRQARKERETAA